MKKETESKLRLTYETADLAVRWVKRLDAFVWAALSSFAVLLLLMCVGYTSQRREMVRHFHRDTDYLHRRIDELDELEKRGGCCVSCQQECEKRLDGFALRVKELEQKVTVELPKIYNGIPCK